MRLVIVLGGDEPQSLAIKAALVDWSALGLLQPFIWAVGEADSAAADIVGDLVVDGIAQRVRVLQQLADSADIDRVQVCTLTMLRGAESGPDQETCGRLRERLSVLGGDASFVHLVVPTADASPASTTLVWPRWHNLLLSPEDSRIPGAVTEQLMSSGEWTVMEAHTCSALASVTGLWLGMAGSLFDGKVQEVQSGIRLLRAFYRRLDARQVTHALRANVLGLSAGLPRPRLGELQMEHFDNPSNAAASVWSSVLGKHAALFACERDVPPRVKRERLTLGAGLKMFFTFLAAAIRDAPKQWLASVIGAASQGVATRATRILFGGEDSAFEVVVLGRSGRSSTDDIMAAVEALTSRTQVAFPDAEMRTGDHSAFWGDVLRAGIGLADGAPSPPGVEPARAGSQQGVMPSADDVVAAPDADLHISGSTAATAGQPSLSAIDRLQTQQVLRRLSAHTGRAPTVEHEKSHTRINDWLRKVDATYIGLVGLHLAQFLEKVQAEVAEVWQRLQTAVATPEASPSLVQAQLKLARRIRWRFIAIVVALLLIGIITGLGVISVIIGVGIAVASVVAWFASSMITFIRGQRELFILIHKQRTEQLALPVWLMNFQRAVRDLNIATGLYEQYRHWAVVLSYFLHEPFGRDRSDPADETPCVMRTNRAFAVATARPSADGIRLTGQRVGPELYSSGWLQDLWGALLTDTFAAVDPIAAVNADRVFVELLRDRATGSSARLPAIAAHLRSHGVSSAGGRKHWTRALEQVRMQQSLLDGLLDNVRSWDGAVLGHGADFLGELTARLPEEPTFDGSIVAVEARASQRWRQGWCANVIGAGAAPRIDYRGTKPFPSVDLTAAATTADGLDSYVLSLLVGGSVPERQITLSPRESPQGRAQHEETDDDPF